jgi:hypothetical protein
VTSPAGLLSELDLLTPDGRRLGTIKGVVIEAAARRVRYFDVQPSGWFNRRRFLMEADQLARLEPVGNALRLRVPPSADTMRPFDPSDLRRYSVDDVIAALCAPRAA